MPWFSRSVRVAPADRRLLARIRRRAATLQALDDDGLRRMADDLRGDPFTRDESLVRAFALVREVAGRHLGMPHYDVQLLAGLVLVRGGIAEMATGEGKTLVTTLPAAVRGLSGGGVHVMTVNAYLAERDYALMRPVYESLGLRVAHLAPGQGSAGKREAYAADIVYGVGSEFGFDYLRDQHALLSRAPTAAGGDVRRRLRGETDAAADTVQRGHAHAIIDEADSVMIDEAGSALILSGAGSRPSPTPAVYEVAREVAAGLVDGRDFTVDRRRRALGLTREGLERAFAQAGGRPPRGLVRPWAQYIEQALKARLFFARDVEYVVHDGRVQIVDEYTGRRFEDRSWSEGLHQAVEAVEGVTITEESRSLVRVSRQRYFRLYDTLCGMTGTARGCEEEFREFYRLKVQEIPLHRPSRRRLHRPRFFADGDARLQAVVADTARAHARGQPVLVGTRTVAESEQLSAALVAAGIEHRVLNALQDAAEAEIIGAAGQRGAVTIATNMAGRGSDIPLGPGVASLGGLLVLGCQAHESARVDRQLLGRAARQGDPGAGRLYIAADDPLLADHDPALAARVARAAGASGVSRSALARELVALQQRVQAARFAQRQELVRRDRWLEKILEQAS